MEIRELRIEHSKNFLELTKITDTEATFLYFEENERKTTMDQQIENR
jgi:hypothetical protein